MERGGYVYIVSNKKRNVLYIGVTSNLVNRISEHENGKGGYFTKRYGCVDLIYFEGFTSIEEAIIREKQMKKWKRTWKERLIKEMNPDMRRLNDKIEDYR
ncbi:MAG: GIY-YIG nuclease family protein [Bacteroidales bacterium]|nr:GIY-YIG nuclease family protein [Bacteroidales bacterium]MBN2820724.1 GIY-YIG nuclease family protein [Bacteroidales bacterium]